MSRLLPLKVEMPRFNSGQIVDFGNFVYVLFGIIAIVVFVSVEEPCTRLLRCNFKALLLLLIMNMEGTRNMTVARFVTFV